MAPRIISLTSIPPRFPFLERTLNSLLKQSADIEEIRLYLPKRYRRFPDWDGTLPPVPNGIAVFQPDEDLGPASKALFAAQDLRHTDCQILFCDDDREYAADWAQALFDAQSSRPNCCVALNGKALRSESFRRRPCPSPVARRAQSVLDVEYLSARSKQIWRSWLLGKHTVRPPRRMIARAGFADVFWGYAGVVIRPMFFDDEAMEIPPILWTVDDYWLSGMLAKNGIPIWLPESLYRPCKTLADNVFALRNHVTQGADRHTANTTCVQFMQSTYGVWT